MILGLIAFTNSSVVIADEYNERISNIFNNKIKPWLSDPVIIKALKKQNEAHASYDDAKIQELDVTWRKEAKVGGGDFIDQLLSRDLSKFLKAKKAEHGSLITEAFVMDNKGMNVGQSDITSDYMQGDELKWQKTYKVGPNAVFIDDVDFDESTGKFQVQVSASVKDPDTNEVLGAITLGMNIEKF